MKIHYTYDTLRKICAFCGCVSVCLVHFRSFYASLQATNLWYGMTWDCSIHLPCENLGHGMLHFCSTYSD